MPEHVMIDGNNLLFAMQTHAPLPSIGRETLVRRIETWAKQTDDVVSLVFDGPTPSGGLSAQMRSTRIDVRFSGSQSADDVIVTMIHASPYPDRVRVISSDTAILHEGRRRRCRCTECAAFIAEIFPAADSEPPTEAREEKPRSISRHESDAWLAEFGIEDDPEPFDGHDALNE
jgi:hypothetical protein